MALNTRTNDLLSGATGVSAKPADSCASTEGTYLRGHVHHLIYRHAAMISCPISCISTTGPRFNLPGNHPALVICLFLNFSPTMSAHVDDGKQGPRFVSIPIQALAEARGDSPQGYPGDRFRSNKGAYQAGRNFRDIGTVEISSDATTLASDAPGYRLSVFKPEGEHWSALELVAKLCTPDDLNLQPLSPSPTDLLPPTRPQQHYYSAAFHHFTLHISPPLPGRLAFP